MENSKTSRLLKLILYLTTSYPKTKDECTDFLGIKNATFYNYCNQLKEIGFDLNQKNGSYFINPNHNNVLQNLLFFSDEEAFVLSEAINNLNTKLPAIASLKHRLLNFLNHDKTVDTYLQKHKNELVQQLVTAIRSKKQVLLVNYSSGNSQTIKNRWVEPFEFKDDFNLLWAFDLEAKKNRQFKTCRIYISPQYAYTMLYTGFPYCAWFCVSARHTLLQFLACVSAGAKRKFTNTKLKFLNVSNCQCV